MIGSFKSAVSKLIHKNGNKVFKWQKSNFDRIIRNNDELTKIRKYIKIYTKVPHFPATLARRIFYPYWLPMKAANTLARGGEGESGNVSV